MAYDSSWTRKPRATQTTEYINKKCTDLKTSITDIAFGNREALGLPAKSVLYKCLCDGRSTSLPAQQKSTSGTAEWRVCSIPWLPCIPETTYALPTGILHSMCSQGNALYFIVKVQWYATRNIILYDHNHCQVVSVSASEINANTRCWDALKIMFVFDATL
ncbi:hypothetical protein BDR05DRAFT_945834 [Suillus weaverae]|nr:hypothetical protein BDR05DRAFT_945834 [Suillus weaverae]